MGKATSPAQAESVTTDVIPEVGTLQPGAKAMVAYQNEAPRGLAVFGRQEDILASLWTSLPAERNREVAIALQASTDRISDHINEVIFVTHVVAHQIQLVDEDTGVVSSGDRVVLIDKEGKTYGAVSEGIRRSLQTLFALYNTPPNGLWKDGLPVKIKQLSTKRGFRTFILEPQV